MNEKVKCISLHSVRYGEKSLVSYLYTREHGRLTLIVNSAFGKSKSSKKAVFFEPLNLLKIVYYGKSKHSMGRLKEVESYSVTHDIRINPLKRAMALFIGEVVYKTVREEESNHFLYDFLENSIQSLEAISEGVSNFHILFLAQLSRYLGFYPNGNYCEETPLFDYKSGIFVKLRPSHHLFFYEENSAILSNAIETPYTQSNNLHLNGKQRSIFLNQMLNFYSFHMDSIQTIKSLSVLGQVFEP